MPASHDSPLLTSIYVSVVGFFSQILSFIDDGLSQLTICVSRKPVWQIQTRGLLSHAGDGNGSECASEALFRFGSLSQHTSAPTLSIEAGDENLGGAYDMEISAGMAGTTDKAALQINTLREVLRRPAPASMEHTCSAAPSLSAREIKKIIVNLVPEADTWVAPRSGGTKALHFLVMSYTSGFPALPPQLSKHCSKGVQLIMGALADPEKAGMTVSRAKVVARTLAEAYTACQAVQARTVDLLQGQVLGLTTQSLPAQLRLLVDEFREAALDRTVCCFHPRAPIAGDETPQEQLPHLANLYRQHLGPSIGTSAMRMEAAQSDRNAVGRLRVKQQTALDRFWQEFDLIELCRAVVADVNQAGEEVERRVDRNLLMQWAGSNPELGYKVFYDETSPDLYGDLCPTDEQRAMQQPCITESFACDLLVSALSA